MPGVTLMFHLCARYLMKLYIKYLVPDYFVKQIY